MLVLDRVGPYDIIERRPEGTSVLCLASSSTDGRRVLVRLLPLADADEHVRERVVGELEALALVQHRNLVEVVDVVDEPGGVGLVTEVLEGDTLESRASATAFDLRTALDVAAQVSAGLHFAHGFGLVHGRLHADQVCVTPEGTAKVMNLGLALVERIVIDPRCTAERIAGAIDTWRLADLRRVGTVLCQALTGREPSASRTARAALLGAARTKGIGSGDPRRPVLEELAGLIDVLLDPGHDPRSRCPDLAALGRILTIARLALDEPFATPAPAKAVAPAADRGPVLHEPDRPGLPTAISPIHTRSGPAELGTAMLLPSLPPPAPRRRRDVIVWAGIGALAVAAGGFALWSSPARREQAPPPPPTWTLSIDSDPQGATVTVDGRPAIELTPLDLSLPVGRDAAIELSLEGYVPTRVPVSETVRLNGRVRVPLQPAPRPPGPAARRVRVTARGSYPFELLQGGRVISATALEHAVELRTGESMQVRSTEHYFERSYRIPAEGLTLAMPPLAAVSVQAPGYEDCTIVIGSQITRQSPGGETFLIPVGSYQFSLRCHDGRRPRARTAAIRAIPMNRVEFAKER